MLYSPFFVGGALLTAAVVALALVIRSGSRSRPPAPAGENSPSSASGDLLAVDAAGIVCLFTPLAQRLFGYAPEEVVGRTLPFVFPSFAPNREHGRRFLSGAAEPATVRTAAWRKDRSLLPLSVAVRPAAANGPEAVVFSLADCAATPAGEAADAAHALASRVSVVLTDVLTNISGYAELAAHDAGDRDALMEDLRQIQRACETGRRLAGKLQRFCIPAAGEAELVDLNAEVRAWAEHLVAAPANMATSLDPDLPKVRMYPRDAHRLLDYLSENASEANAAAVAIQTDVDTGAGVAVLRVRDSGSGFDEKDVAVLGTMPFSRKGGHASLGSGLAAVSRILQRYDGYFTVRNESGGGATVSVYLPISE